MAGSELAKLIGEQALGDIGGRVAQRALVTGAKAATLLASPSEDQGLEAIDLSGVLDTGSPFFRTRALVPGQYAKAPELFYGPFLQLGTFLKGKGLVESEGVVFALDLALDPLNLVSGGTLGAAGKLTGGLVSGLSKAGLFGRLLNSLSQGGKIRNGAKIVEAATDTLEAAFKVANVGDDVYKAAQAGNTSALKTLLKSAQKSGRLTDEQATLVAALRRDAKSLGRLMEHTDEFAKIEQVPAGAFLQSTVRARFEAGQVFGPLGIARPANPIKEPLRFTRQMLGFSYKESEFWWPMSRLSAEGLDKVGLGTVLTAKGATKLTEGVAAEVATTLEAQDALKGAFGRPAQKGNQVNPVAAMLPA